MEILLAIVVFGLMLAFALYGYSRSQAAARGRGDFGRGDNFAMVAGNNARADSPSSPNPDKQG